MCLDFLKCDKAVNFMMCGRSWVREMSSECDVYWSFGKYDDLMILLF